MEKVVDKGQFRDMFKGRAVPVRRLPPGRSQDLANQVNEAEGRGDSALRSKAEFSALFDLLTQEFDGGDTTSLVLLGDDGRPTAAGHAVEDYLEVAEGKDDFFDEENVLRPRHGLAAGTFPAG